jgi:hypothetical protein
MENTIHASLNYKEAGPWRLVKYCVVFAHLLEISRPFLDDTQLLILVFAWSILALI